MADQKVRQQKFEQVQQKYDNRREARYEREAARFDHMEAMQAQQDTVLRAKKEFFNAGKKNEGGAAYNLINLGYDPTGRGQQLAQHDEDSRVRALMRAKNLNDKSNGAFDILTGSERQRIQVPQHERYNPIANAGAQVMQSGSRGSQRTNNPLW